MSITFDLPADVVKDLEQQLGDLNKAARDAFIIDSYRTGRLSLGAVASLLSLETTIQAQAWLAAKSVPINYSIEDLEADRRTLGKLFKGRG